jgi:hypothetical protein
VSKELWLKQVDWHLRRRACITLDDSGVPDSYTQTLFEQGISPMYAARDIIEDGSLDDCVSDPWVGPSKEYWAKWERENPFPDSDPAGLRHPVSGKTVSKSN